MKAPLLHILLTVAMLLATNNASAYSAGYYATTSKLATGHWVKVEIDTTGIFEISHSQLRELGFSDPGKVHVYGYGGVVATEQSFSADYPDDLPQTASMHTSDGRLLFFGEGDVRGNFGTSTTHNQIANFKRNYYDNKAYYFLSDTDGGHELATVALGETEDAIDWSYCIDLIEREVQNPANGGVFFHGPKLKAGEKENFTFHIRDYCSGGSIAKGYFRYEAAVLPAEKETVTLPISASENVYIVTNTPTNSGKNTSDTSYYIKASGRATFDATEERPLDDAHVTFTITIPSSFTGTYAAIDYAYVTYARHNRLAGRSDMVMRFDPNQSKAFTVLDAYGSTEVWNVTDPTACKRYELAFNEAERSATGCMSADDASKATRLIAFDTSARHRPVRIAGTVAPQNLHGEPVPDMLIATTAELYEEARALADLHRREQGFDVLVVRQEEAFNEFSSGCKHPGGIRRLAKRFYDLDPAKFRFLLMYGYTTWDPRGLTHRSDKELICFEVENDKQARESVTNYCADQYFGMLADNYDHATIYRMPMSISVGRVPVENAGQAKAFNAKMARYFAEPPSVNDFTRAIFTSGDENDNAHLYQSNDAANGAIAKNSAITANRGDKLLFAEDSPDMVKYIERNLYRGLGFFNYCGHGTSYELSGANFYMHHITQYRYRSWPFAMLATCNAFPLDYLRGDFSSKMLFKEDGGAIGVVGACRSVYLEHNHHINKAIAEAYASANAGTCTGELLKNARNSMIANGMQSSLGYNTLCYNLCGDPAMPLPAPDYSIRVETIAGEDANGDEALSFPAGSKVRLTARVVDAEGNTVGDFNGTVSIDIFDTPDVRVFTRTRPNNTVETTYINIDDKTLTTLSVAIANGVIDASIALPYPSGEGSNRISLTATDSRQGLTATGAYNSLSIEPNDKPVQNPDARAPEIEAMYIDSPDFVSGDRTGPTFTFVAVADPSESGLATSPKALTGTRLTLDDKNCIANAPTSFRIDEDGKARLEIKMTDLSDGPHSLELRVANTLGASTSARLDFTVVSEPAQACLSVDGELPVRTSATFALDTFEPELSSARLVVRDSHGNTVVSKSGVSFPYTWDLTDMDGETVADGLYKAHVVFATPRAYGSTDAVEIVVIK